MPMNKTVTLSVDQRARDGALQLAINVEDADGGSIGYRIAGPKYDGSGKTLLRHVITEADKAAIMSALRGV
jgi:hypothetical protein